MTILRSQLAGVPLAVALPIQAAVEPTDAVCERARAQLDAACATKNALR